MTFILWFTLLFFSYSVTSEPTGRFIIEAGSNSECLDDWWQQMGLQQSAYVKRKLSIGDWWVVEIPASYQGSLEKLSCISGFYIDHPIIWRDKDPNDPSFINQADMELIGMPAAWDIATGGVTSRGDTIVVALIDTGFQPDHIDLKDNIWKNRLEIPDDGIDNDANGYTDDHLGWNISTKTDKHLPAQHHGTSVSGIVGAKGNNGTGIAGINWNVKMMIVSGADFESELIEAYNYVLQMRKRYRMTNGAEGAFIVATNLSGGVNNAWAADHPLWCGMYDQLGAEGILSVTAAPNLGISVDADGDMPTTCTSDFMIAVTNVDVTDNILPNAGHGPVSIDLGAPGHGSLTTNGNNTYREFPGTSAAAPHVTGVIALIYNAACDRFLQSLDSDPPGLAITIKNIILNSGRNNNSLKDITLTGKRLQADAALRETISSCDHVGPEEVAILRISPNPGIDGTVEVQFQVRGDTSTAFMELYAANGSLVGSWHINAVEFSQGFIQINTASLVPGIYYISLRSRKAKSVASLFIK